MPHIKFITYKENKLPVSNGIDTTINFIAYSKKESLISCTVNHKSFFLSLGEKDNYYLLKPDKKTRISPSNYIIKAIKLFRKHFIKDILFSNISAKENEDLKNNTSYLKNIDFFDENFFSKRQIYIEIGFGSGRHLISKAKEKKDAIFIGIEIHKPSLDQVNKRLKAEDLKNVYLLDFDVRIFLEKVKSNSINGIYLHFPVPWDKNENKRIISKEFLKEVQRILKKDASFELRTDSLNYYKYSLGILNNFDNFNLNIKKNENIIISSKYEDRWKKLNKDIYDIILLNNKTSKELEIKEDFLFCNTNPSKLKTLIGEKIIDNDFFIKFNNIYKTNDLKELISLNLGAFNKPESLYLMKDKNIYYYPNKPSLSLSNIKAHKKIKELINE